MYEVRFLDEAENDFEHLDRHVQESAVRRIAWLAQNIESIKCHALAGALSGLCKLRAGDYRILYQIVRDERLIIIHAIAHRSIVYKRR